MLKLPGRVGQCQSIGPGPAVLSGPVEWAGLSLGDRSCHVWAGLFMKTTLVVTGPEHISNTVVS